MFSTLAWSSNDDTVHWILDVILIDVISETLLDVIPQTLFAPLHHHLQLCPCCFLLSEREEIQLHDAQELPGADQAVPVAAAEEALGAGGQDRAAGERAAEAAEHGQPGGRTQGEAGSAGSATRPEERRRRQTHPQGNNINHYSIGSFSLFGIVRLFSKIFSLSIFCF